MLTRICLPPLLEKLSGRAFRESGIAEIEVAAGNRCFRVSGDFLLSFDGISLIQYFGRSVVVRIPTELEAIGNHAFSISRSVGEIQFEATPRLRRIGRRAFWACLLQSFCIPADVDSLDGSTFVRSKISEIRVAEGNHHFERCGNFVQNRDGTSLVVYLGRDTDVIVPREIRVLSSRVFAESSIRSVSFESESQLRRIEPRVFACCLCLKVLCIPSFVEAIDGSAFVNAGIRDIRIGEGNTHFRVSGPFLLNSEGTSLIRYFEEIHRELEPPSEGFPPHMVTVSREIDMISAGSFEASFLLKTLQFEPGSQLRCIGEKAFAHCAAISSISIPASTEVLSRSCFRDCASLAEFHFEAGSKLRRIEGDSFRSCDALKGLFIPMSVKGNDGVDLSGKDDIEIVWI
jgi:hypothetical protein